MKAYYAHCVALYNTLQEERDLDLLGWLGFDITNPNNPQVQADVEKLKAALGARNRTDMTPETGADSIMAYFRKFVEECDVLVFRALPDGRISSGVADEIGFAREYGKPIIELPSNVTSRRMSLEATREYLHEVGNR